MLSSSFRLHQFFKLGIIRTARTACLCNATKVILLEVFIKTGVTRSLYKSGITRNLLAVHKLQMYERVARRRLDNVIMYVSRSQFRKMKIKVLKDLAKVFDAVVHKEVLQILYIYILFMESSKGNNWVKYSVTFALPQGTILGHILFLSIKYHQ